MRRPGTWALAAALLLGWLLLAPTALGGTTTYVTTHGTSMEPTFVAGDLALVRPAEEYRVGDAVAYHSDLLDTTVLHRIVAAGDGRFTLQGDNNPWLDPEQPTEAEIIGSLVLTIPQGGVWLDRLTSPLVLAALTAVLILAGGTTAHTRRRKKRRRTVSAQAAHPSRTRPLFGPLPPVLVPLAYASAAIGLLGAILGFLAWTAPTTQTATHTGPSRTVTFSYTAQVPPTPAYDDTTVESPDPVFRKLAQNVQVDYHYTGEPGTVSVSAELAAANGWRTTIPLAPKTTFTDPEHHASVELDLRALDRRVQRAGQAIGLPMDQVTLTLTPRFTSADGNAFEPELPLTLSPTALALSDPATLQADADPTETTEATEPRQLTILGATLAVPTARTLSAALLALALLAALALHTAARTTQPATEAAAIRRRYSQILVPVEPMTMPAGRPVVDVTDMPTLVKLAERYGLLVLHWTRADLDTFIVADENTTYRYRASTPAPETPQESPLEADEHTSV